tara:strand:+ start:2478 stop:3038 length:561 start_codon:yes stop_codon:yes gene_type:complete
MKTLFPIQYHHVHIRDHKETFGKLYDSCKDICKEVDGKWNCSVNSTFFDENDIVAPEQLGALLSPYLYQYFPPEVELKIVNSWLNVYNKGQHQEPHHHVQFPEFINFSGVIFLNYDKEKDAPFYFENMNLDHTISGYTHIFKQNPIMYPQVRQGDLIVFPSFVRHGVLLQKEDSNRTTLSFNLDVR